MAPFLEVSPSSAQYIDTDNAIKSIAKNTGWSQDLIKDDKAVQGIRDAQAKAQQEQLERESEQQDLESAGKINQIQGGPQQQQR